MLKIALVVAGLSLLSGDGPAEPHHLQYALRVDSADLSRISVELRVPAAPAGMRLAAHAHPEYDDKYWRYVEDLRASAEVWQAGH